MNTACFSGHPSGVCLPGWVSVPRCLPRWGCTPPCPLHSGIHPLSHVDRMNEWHYLPTTLFAGGNNTLSNQLLLVTELDGNLFVRSSQVLVVIGAKCNIALFSSVGPTHYQRSARTTFHRTTADRSWTTTSSPRHKRCSRARASGPSHRRYRGPGPLRVSNTGAVPEPQ